MPLADLGDRKLFYVRRGSGEPLLLIQGMAGHVPIWGEPLLSRLEKDFDVVAYEHRGIGESDEVEGDFSITDLADDAVALLDVLGIASAHVFGISMGGMVAQELALRHPERVRRLVLGCTDAGGAERLLGPGPMEMFEAMQTGDRDKAVRAAFRANLSADFTADEANYAPFAEASLATRVRVPVVIAQAQAAFVHDAADRLGALRVPTLVLHGTADRMVPFANAERLVAVIPGAQLHSFDGAGHLFWWERPAEAAELVREHLLG